MSLETHPMHIVSRSVFQKLWRNITIPYSRVPIRHRHSTVSPSCVQSVDGARRRIFRDLLVDREPARVLVRKAKVHLIRNGSPLVFSGAVERIVGNDHLATGDLVLIADVAKEAFAWGVYNSESMYSVRVMQTEAEVLSDPSCLFNMDRLIRKRIGAAAELRCILGLPCEETNVYRLLNGEGDRLSGLVVDVLGEHLVVSSSAAWVEKYRQTIEMALSENLGPRPILWRPSLEILKEEGLQLEDPTDLLVDLPDEGRDVVEVVENGVRFKASLSGQKTGFYADQRESRKFLGQLCKGKTVLDLCCYSGGFGLNAAVGGASHVTGVDSSGPALELAKANALLNGFEEARFTFLRQDIKKFMNGAVSEGKKWDVVVLDPPKLAPSRKHLARATSLYRRFNAAAMMLVNSGGLLMTCSCSGAMTQSGLFPLRFTRSILASRKKVHAVAVCRSFA